MLLQQTAKKNMLNHISL